MTVEEAKAADKQDIIEWLRHHVRELESAHGVYKAAAVRLMELIRDEVLVGIADGQLHGGPQRCARIVDTYHDIRRQLV